MPSDCRLLYVVGQLGAGGLERQLYFLLQQVDRERYRPAVFAWNLSENDPYVARLRAIQVPLYSAIGARSAVAKLRALRATVFQLRPRIVHSYSYYTNVAAWFSTVGTNSIPIGAVQSNFIADKRDAGRCLGNLSARWPRLQIYNSFLAAENARRTGGLFMPAQLFVVRNGLNLQMFESVPANVSSQAVILGIGSLLPVKRWDRLIKAAAALKRCGLDCVVQIAGSGPLQRSLEVQAEGLGVRERVEFLGYVDDIPALLARSTFVVHTSDVEGCSNAVMEAMASRRAVVATDAGDTCSIVQEGQTGFVVSRGDDAALFDRIARLIRDRQLCRRMGDAGRIKAEREFGADRLVSETLAVYRAAGGTDL